MSEWVKRFLPFISLIVLCALIPLAEYFVLGQEPKFLTSGNLDDARGRNFELYAVNTDGGAGQGRITFNKTFDGFPMFSTDGKKLVFCSNRHDAKQGDTNVFIADWVE